MRRGRVRGRNKRVKDRKKICRRELERKKGRRDKHGIQNEERKKNKLEMKDSEKRKEKA